MTMAKMLFVAILALLLASGLSRCTTASTERHAKFRHGHEEHEIADGANACADGTDAGSDERQHG